MAQPLVRGVYRKAGLSAWEPQAIQSVQWTAGLATAFRTAAARVQHSPSYSSAPFRLRFQSGVFSVTYVCVCVEHGGVWLQQGSHTVHWISATQSINSHASTFGRHTCARRCVVFWSELLARWRPLLWALAACCKETACTCCCCCSCVVVVVVVLKEYLMFLSVLMNGKHFHLTYFIHIFIT